MKERELQVFLGKKQVGTMKETADHRIAFAYTPDWLEHGFAISPFSPINLRTVLSADFGGISVYSP